MGKRGRVSGPTNTSCGQSLDVRRLQDFYSVYGDNALFITTTFYKTSAVLKYIGGPEGVGIPGASAPLSWHTTGLPGAPSLKADCLQLMRMSKQTLRAGGPVSVSSCLISGDAGLSQKSEE